MTERTHWNPKKHAREVVPEVDEFLQAVMAVSRQHGLWLGHEDGHGNFEVYSTPGDREEWLAQADWCGGNEQ